MDDLTKSILEEIDNKPDNENYSSRNVAGIDGDDKNYASSFGLFVAICAAALLFGGETFNWWTVTWEFENVDTEEDGFAFEGKVVLEHGMDEGHVVGVFGQVRIAVGEETAGLAVLLKRERAAHAHMRKIETGLQFTDQFGRPWQRFPMQFCQFRLVIERVHVAHATLHEQKNTLFGSAGQVARQHRQWVSRCCLERRFVG